MFTTGLVVFVVVYAICSLRSIREDEMAVVTIFGNPQYVVGSGLRVVPFLIGDLVIYPTVKLEIEPNDVAVVTKRKNPIGSAPVTLKAMSVRMKFEPGNLLETVVGFPKPPKRRADGSWEPLGNDWKTLVDEAIGSVARDFVGEMDWEELFNHRDKLGRAMQTGVMKIPNNAGGQATITSEGGVERQFSCFTAMRVVVGEVDLGPLTTAIARQETARQEAQGAIVDAQNYAAVTTTKAAADKEAAILKGEGAAQATRDQIEALGGDARTLAAIELAKSGSTVVLPSTIVDAIGGIGGKTTNVHLGGGSPNAAPDSEVQSSAAEKQTHDSIERQVATLEAAGVNGLKQVLTYLPVDQRKLLLQYLEVGAADVEILSVRTAVSMLSPKQKRIVFQWFMGLTKKGEV